MKRSQKIVTNAYSSQVLEFLLAEGISLRECLKGTSLTAEELQEKGGMISPEQELQLYTNALVLSNTPDLGLRLGGALHCYHAGLYGYALQSSATMHQVIVLHSKYSALVSYFLTWKLQLTDEVYRLYLQDRYPLVGLHRLMLEEVLVGTHNLFMELSDGRLEFSRLRLDFPPPEYVQRYRDIFHCPLEFDAERSEIIIARSQGEIPIRSYDPQTSELCEQRCEQIIARLKEAEDTTEKVRRAILELPCHNRSTEAVAERLHMGPRHLRRKLQEEGVTFQQVLNEVRFELAKDYILQTNLSVEEVGELVGFSETNNFRRAFKSWVGLTPRDYRNQVTGAP